MYFTTFNFPASMKKCTDVYVIVVTRHIHIDKNMKFAVFSDGRTTQQCRLQPSSFTSKQLVNRRSAMLWRSRADRRLAFQAWIFTHNIRSY